MTEFVDFDHSPEFQVSLSSGERREALCYVPQKELTSFNQLYF
jgi:hypothetical protein